MEDGDDLPQFWQPPTTLTRRHRRPSPFLNSSLIIILLPSLLLLFTVFIIVPSISKILPHNNNNNPVVNTAPQIPKKISVKKGWHTLNIILVLFAILCGIFAKRNDDVPTTPGRGDDEVRSDNGQVQQDVTPPYNTTSSSNTNGVLLQTSKSVMMQPQWFDQYSHQQQISSPLNTSPAVTGISRLRRTVSSDPYMKFTGNSQFLFFDDLDVRKFYPKEEPQPQVKEIPVDSFVPEKSEELPSPTISPPQTPPRNPPTPPPPPPPPPLLAKQRRTFQTPHRKEQAPPPPPPPPPPKPPRGREEKKRSSRKRTTKEIATAIVSLYNQGKRKRRMKTSRNQEHRFPPHESHSQFIPPPSPPPPPPPPPVFHNWFKKGSKTKKVNSRTSTPTPPLPPKPPLPKRRARGSESPNIGIPTPPPPPPFKEAEMSFAVVGGGYVNVKVRSAQNSRSGSPEMNGGDEMKMKGGDGERVACPSLDVNLKADTFIARHHNGWRLEKLNSWREKLNKAGHGPTF